jgi:DNA uptake protein ComE-like DNA-binding protein
MQVRDVTRVMVAGYDKAKYHETNSLVTALRGWGLKTMKGGCTSDTKFIPDFVLGLADEDIAFFLASLWDCDGHIGQRLCFMKTISLKMATDIQTLLLRLGIYSTTYEAKYHNNRRDTEMTAYQITVYNLKLFKDLIAPHLVSKSMHEESHFTGIEKLDAVSRPIFLEEFSNAWQGSKRGFMSQYGFDRQHIMPAGIKRPRINVSAIEPVLEVLDMPQTQRNINVHWAAIESIVPIGEELVYDITVDKIHNFVGNNVILHNCVYQEQIMLLSQKLANFTKGDADVLRKAMGKKQIAVLNKMKAQFLSGCELNKHDTAICEKVWTDWEAFASYAFNKSHSTCYAFVAYQTAYLKAHYPAEYMAAVLSNNQSNIEKITFFMEECRSSNISVKGPDVNESNVKFSVNKKSDVRFALSAIKGVGEAAVEALIEERKQNGPYLDIFDFVRRQNLRTVNKRVMEALTQSGAFDGFGISRATFFAPSDKYETFIEHLLKYGAGYQHQKASASTSLFGESVSDSMMEAPSVPKVEEWNLIQKLNYEKDCVGIYLSGHPLDDFKVELAYANTTLDKVQDLKNQRVKVCAFVSSVSHRVSRKGTGFGSFVIQDYKGSQEFALFNEDYARFSPILLPGVSVLIEGDMKQKWNSEEFELKIKDVKQLASLGNSMTESITLMIPIEIITEGLIKELEQLCQKFKGKHKLKTHLIDERNRQTLHLFSTEKKVNVDSDFISAVEAKGLTYKLN